MGLLALVNGVMTSFGGTTTQVAVKDTDNSDILERILVELRILNMILIDECSVTDTLDTLRTEAMETLT